MIKERYYYNLRCCICGKFVKPDADCATHYGSADDAEPPDEVLFCPACIEVEKEWHRKYRSLPHYWRQPNWAYELAEELDMEEVRIDGYWQWKKRVPRLFILEQHECEQCGGAGIVNVRYYWTERDGEDDDGGQACSYCNGLGYVEVFQCATCKGKKYIMVDSIYPDLVTGLREKVKTTCPTCLGKGTFDEDEVEPENERSE